MLTLEIVFEEFANFLLTFFWAFNQGLKLFFNDIVIFEIPLGWWFITFALIGIVSAKMGGEL